jgi:hypothetical protein
MSSQSSLHSLSLPRELTDEIIGYLYADVQALRACARTHRSWTPAARSHLFERILLSNLASWSRLVSALVQSPSIISYIKDVTIDNQSGFLQYAVRDKDGPEAPALLGDILSDVLALEIRATIFNSAQDIVTQFVRTHFLRIRQLRLSAVSAPSPAALQDFLLTPRSDLCTLSLSHVSVSDPVGGRAMELMKYEDIEMDRYAFSMPTDFHSNWMFHDDLHNVPQSYVKRLQIHGIHYRNFPFLSHALQAIGSSLEVLKVDVRSHSTIEYPSGVHFPNSQHLMVTDLCTLLRTRRDQT